MYILKMERYTVWAKMMVATLLLVMLVDRVVSFVPVNHGAGKTAKSRLIKPPTKHLAPSRSQEQTSEQNRLKVFNIYSSDSFPNLGGPFDLSHVIYELFGGAEAFERGFQDVDMEGAQKEINRMEKSLKGKIDKARSAYGAEAVDKYLYNGVKVSILQSVTCRVVKDAAWKDPTSSAFKTKFIKHSVPWIRDIATLKQNIYTSTQKMNEAGSGQPTVMFSRQWSNFGDSNGGAGYQKKKAESEYKECRKYAVSVLGESFVAK
jgi:hypothetical protein